MNAKNLLCLFLFIVSASQIAAQEIFDAINENNFENVKLILDNNPDQLKIKNARGSTPLISAASKGNLEIVQYLIMKGADVNEANNFKTNALHFASFFNHYEIVKLLVENGADIDAANNQGQVAVYFAAANGGYETVKYLLEKGADLHFKDINNNTLLNAASINGNAELVKFLIGKGLDPEREDKFGKTSIYYAAEKGLKEIINLFISQEIKDITMTTTDGSTYLHAAAKGNLFDFAKKVIDAGVDVNKSNLFGSTPFSIAKEIGSSEIVKLLIDSGAETTLSTETNKGDYLGMELPGQIPALFAPGIVSTAEYNERDVTFSLNGNEFYFTKWPINNLMTIMVMKQSEEGWTDAVAASFMKKYNHAEACFTPDDKQLFFISNRPAEGEGDAENWEIWFTERTDSNWNEPKILGEEFKGGFYPTFTNDWTMYYTDANADISRANLIDGKYTNIHRFNDAVNTEDAEYNSCIAPDESYLIFTSDGFPDQFGQGDFYICFRKEDGTWTKAKNMGPVINSWARDYCPAISRDGKYFFFASRKYGTEDIFWVSTKLFNELRP